jgi:P4 family phage/plasmid primase-like protien
MGDHASAGNGRLAAAAVWYAKKGWTILPVHGISADGRCTCGKPHGDPKDIGKHPALNNWNTEASSDPEVVAKWWEQNPDYNIGLVCNKSGLFAIDVDPRSGGDTSIAIFDNRTEGAVVSTVEAMTGEYNIGRKIVRGSHLLYQVDESEKLIGKLDKEGLKGVDIKHNGYILLAPSRHFSGITYDWKPGHEPWKIDVTPAPEELLSALRSKALKGRAGGSSYREGSWDWLEDLEFAGDKVDIAKVLEDGIEEGSRAVEIYRLACALANKFGTTPESRLMIESMMIRFNHEMVRPPMELEGQNSLLMHTHRAIDFVASNPKIDRGWEGLTEWVNSQGKDWAEGAQAQSNTASFMATDIAKTSVVGNTVSQLVEQGYSVTEASGNGNLNIPKDVDAVSEEDGGRPGYRTMTDVGNGRRLIDTYGSAVRYTPGLGWFHWNGTYWKPDTEDLEMNELAKRIAPVIASEVLNYGDDQQQKKQDLVNWSKQAKSNSRLSNMIKSSNSDPRVVVGVEQWDGSDHLLGVMNGVVDLKTGEKITGKPDLYITKRAQVNYTPGLRNVRWEQFLDYATGGDKELQEWIQKAVGYTLTGLSNQDVLFLVYGPSGSGKNTFVETIVKALGTDDYAGTLPSESLAAGNGNGSNTSQQYYLAELRGKRMIWVDELPESERINENQIKQMTGSSTIQGRSPGEKPFTFKAQGKLWITTNHRPIINDDAMWRRLRPIPWVHVAEKPDPDLKAFLADPEGGLPAVLAWAVEGAVKYLGSSAKDPLGWCSAVLEASAIYRKNEDRLGLFLDEETNESEGASVLVKRLFGVYRIWSEERGERPMTQIAFQRKMSDRGLQVVGQGARAEIKNRSLAPRVVQDAEVDWSMATRFAKNY